jgi:hypothetical protein
MIARLDVRLAASVGSRAPCPGPLTRTGSACKAFVEKKPRRSDAQDEILLF